MVFKYWNLGKHHLLSDGSRRGWVSVLGENIFRVYAGTNSNRHAPMRELVIYGRGRDKPKIEITDLWDKKVQDISYVQKCMFLFREAEKDIQFCADSPMMTVSGLLNKIAF